MLCCKDKHRIQEPRRRLIPAVPHESCFEKILFILVIRFEKPVHFHGLRRPGLLTGRNGRDRTCSVHRNLRRHSSRSCKVRVGVKIFLHKEIAESKEWLFGSLEPSSIWKNARLDLAQREE